ncbi:amidohydrolase [Halobacteriales archaeon SW_10_68_16]|jgi:aminobenzoyl-glutamate utilization protein A|nr:MAG: amidohydrolase [Halobacteriales archaeon SW_10_68_16]
MDTTTSEEWLRSLRRDLHRRPEPAWCEFYTTARIVEEIREIGVDELYVGRDALATGARSAVPDEGTLATWYDRAGEAGAPADVLGELEGGYTGAVAVLHRGEGPTVALRVDIDGLPREESDDPEHLPAREGFRSANEGAMHACGHDAHATIGLGVLRAVAGSDFQGTFKLVFQPAEERIGGGEPIAESGHLDDVDFLLALHIGLDHPTGEVVAGIDDFLAVSHFEAHFSGESAHAGGHPNRGRNAVQAMATAIQNLYAIPRHEGGATRINAGKVAGGTATNIVPEGAVIEGEVRGATTDLMEYTREHAERMLESAAEMHDCSVEIERGGEAPSAKSDDEVVDAVAAVAEGVEGVESVVRRDDLGGSEDASYLMRRVQQRGGVAGYVCIGTDHPGGHHTATFDVDEDSLSIGVDVLAGAVLSLARGS